MTLLEPSPILLALIVFKSFVYLECLALLSVVRAAFSSGAARWLALLSLGLACLGAWSQLAPVLGPGQTAPALKLLPAISRLLAWQQGIPALLLASLPLALSATRPGRRFRAIDILHIMLIAALVGLWLAARFV